MFIRKGLITRGLPKFETKLAETLSVALTVSKKKWFILFAYRHLQHKNWKIFFEETYWSLSTIVNKYDYIMLIGDLNLNTKSRNNIYYSDFCDTLKNLIKSNTSIDVILTNQPWSFQKHGAVTTGLSDCHKMVLTFLPSYFSRCLPKTITEVLDFLWLKISYTNWKGRYSPNTVKERLIMIT